MRRWTCLFLVAFCAAALCFATRANAQGEEPFSWTGFYIGGNIGGLSSHYGFGAFTDEVDVDAQFAELPALYRNLFGPQLNIASEGEEDTFGSAEFAFPSTGPGFSTFSHGSDQSILGGGQLGYNRQFGHFVVGIEGDFQGTSASKSQLSSGFIETVNEGEGEPPPPPPQGLFDDTFGETTLIAERKAETDWTASLRARFGYAVGHLLFYGTAGVAFTDVKVTATETASTDFFSEVFQDDIIGGPVLNGEGGGGGPIGNFLGNVTTTNFSKSDDDVKIGWTGGVGSEWAINKTVTLGVEYRHSDYGSSTYHFVSNQGIIFPGDTKVDLDTDQVTFRVNILISNFFGH